VHDGNSYFWPGGTVTTQSPSLLVATPWPFEDDDDEDDAPPEDDGELAGPVVEDATPFGPAVTSLAMRPASLRLEETPADGASTLRQGFPLESVLRVFPSGPVLVETDPPDPELDEEELEAACAAPIVATAITAAARIKSDERVMGVRLMK
jgi:hypothetical protein